MRGDLQNRVALVTGASKGIGSAISMRLAESGATVALCARASDALTNTVKRVRDEGLSAFAVPGDATDANSAREVVAGVMRAAGRLDILVNNVGGAVRFGAFTELAAQDWQKAFELNVMSMVHFIHAALPSLEKSAAARIINISSISGVEPGAFNPHYTTTKAATINLTKVLANSFAARKILVNVVCPGPVHSVAWDENIAQTALRRDIPLSEAATAVEAEEAAKVPLRRIGEGRDVAGLVAFLASDEASWITGACFHVSGGKMRST
jgi:3-oxoacyl-[acyl-carrier protein] reductase